MVRGGAASPELGHGGDARGTTVQDPPLWRLDRALLDVWSLCEARARVREGRHADGEGFSELTVLRRGSTARAMLG